MSTDAAVDLGALFDSASRSVVRLEVGERYRIDEEDTSYAAWCEGRPRPERSVRTDSYLRRVAAAAARGVAWERLRVIDTPPTPYQQWELLAYVENEAVGDRTTITPRDLVPLAGDDVWIVDDQAVVVDYDPDGAWQGFTLARPHHVAVYRQIADLVRANGLPLNEYLAGVGAVSRAS